MNSISSQKQVASQIKNKARAMATKYEKYQKKKSMESTSSKIICFQKWVKKINLALTNAWNIITPTFIRGSSTPYETFIKSVPRSLKSQLQNLPLCQLSLAEAIQRSKINLIITYNESLIRKSLESLNNNQQINSLINKGAQIIPMKISPPLKNSVPIKLKELIDQLGLNDSQENYVFVIWKGLYQEILVIAQYQLSDPDLSLKAIRAVQQRQEYEELIRRLANQTEIVNEQSSLNHLSEQSTGISKEEVD